jgi:hypothetical protein
MTESANVNDNELVELTDQEIEDVFLDHKWSWGERADMYIPVGRDLIAKFIKKNHEQKM